MENFIIGPMTPWGPFATGFVGLLCAFVLYGLIMKYPAGKGDVVKIGDQIHLGAKVFMITEYKSLLQLLLLLSSHVVFPRWDGTQQRLLQ